MKERKELNINIGRRIQIARESFGITQEKLAEEIDKSPQFVSDLERGVTGTSIATLIKICKTLSVSSDYLLMGYESNIEPFDISLKWNFLTPSERNLINSIIDLILKTIHADDSSILE